MQTTLPSFGHLPSLPSFRVQCLAALKGRREKMMLEMDFERTEDLLQESKARAFWAAGQLKNELWAVGVAAK